MTYDKKLWRKPQRTVVVRHTKDDNWVVLCHSIGVHQQVTTLEEIMYIVRSNPDYNLLCRFESEV